MAEEIEVEKCNLRNFRSSVTLTLTLDQVEVTLVHISGQGLSTHTPNQIEIRKLFVDGQMYVQTDRPEFQSIKSLLGDDLIIIWYHPNTGDALRMGR